MHRVDRATAERRLEVEDKACTAYVRRAYAVEGEDPRLYHLMLDSTALTLDTYVELIVTAGQARICDPRPTHRPSDTAHPGGTR